MILQERQLCIKYVCPLQQFEYVLKWKNVFFRWTWNIFFQKYLFLRLRLLKGICEQGGKEKATEVVTLVKWRQNPSCVSIPLNKHGITKTMRKLFGQQNRNFGTERRISSVCRKKNISGDFVALANILA